MAHMIDMSNDRANMAYVGEVPWHGLGHVLKPDASIEEWTKAAGLDWTANVEPVYVQRNGEFIAVPERIHVTRSDTNGLLGAFTNNYIPAQPSQILGFFNDFVLTDERFQMETAGALKDGRVIWALARFQDVHQVVGEEHIAYVLLATSFDGTLATTAQATETRVVCQNTLTASIFDPKSASVKIRHDREFSGVVVDDAHDQLIRVAESFEQYKAMAERLVSIQHSRSTAQKFLKKLVEVAPPKDAAPNEKDKPFTESMRMLYECLDATIGEGTERDTAWTTFNAVTRFVDHHKGARGLKGEAATNARMASSFFGDGLQLKSKALKGLLELV